MLREQLSLSTGGAPDKSAKRQRANAGRLPASGSALLCLPHVGSTRDYTET